MPPSDQAIQLAQDMLDFIDASDTQFHAVSQAKSLLFSAGFSEIYEKDSWKGTVIPGGRYFFSRNDSSLVAFAIGSKYVSGTSGFHLIGAHTDSPCFKLKPHSAGKKSGYLMVNCEPYGGLLQHCWFDRDLTVAGKVLVKDNNKNNNNNNKVVSRLVKIDKPILRIPMLAIHLNRDIGSEGFKPNKQTQCTPILSAVITDALSKQKEGEGDESADKKVSKVPPASSLSARHHPLLLNLLSKQLQCSVDDIVDFELNVVDCQPGAIGGGEDEFVFVGRLDNLCSSYCAIRALIDTTTAGDGDGDGESSLAEETNIRCVALFDNEEVGSDSAQGAGSPLMADTISRVATLLAATNKNKEEDGEEGVVQRCLTNSFLISADMAHALHPNYSDKHDSDHAPKLGSGMVLKHNANQRYATASTSASLFRQVCLRAGVPTAEFSVRSDMACGSTIGPILASGLGLRVVDVGVPQLAMHSIREMCAVVDVAYCIACFRMFYKEFSDIKRNVDPDIPSSGKILGEMIDVPCHHL